MKWHGFRGFTAGGGSGRQIFRMWIAVGALLGISASRSLVAQAPGDLSVPCVNDTPGRMVELGLHRETNASPSGEILLNNGYYVPDKDLEKYVATLCFPRRKFGEPRYSEADHQLKDVSGSVVLGSVIPELGAFNINRSDLEAGGRIVAKVVLTGDFPSLGFSKGINYVWMSRERCGNDASQAPCEFCPHGEECDYQYRVVVLKPGTPWIRTPFKTSPDQFVEHGHDPFAVNEVHPPFSRSVNTCKAGGEPRRACFVDGEKTWRLDRLPKLSPSAVLALRERQATYTTGTWYTLNGICFCQGTGCH